MRIEEFDYYLPKKLIAQHPLEKRDECRLMIVDRKKDTIEHHKFYDVLDYIDPGDCLVLNDSRVIPARIYGTKESTGAQIETLLIKKIEGDDWEAMVRPGKRLRKGDVVIFDKNKTFKGHILGHHDRENGTRRIRFEYDGIFMERLDEIGSMPLPPYIERPAEESDKKMYQTVYSRIDGSVAAPTAGLHFTEELLDKAVQKGIKIAYVTLHVGIGTFRPVKCDKVKEHRMHFEECSISQESADIINDTIRQGGRIISVGTTSTRTLESMAVEMKEGYRVQAGEKSTGIFIYPGYKYKIIDALITNFHLPKSTLIMLVSALYSKDKILKAYEVAIREEYRFFSYGDAMMIV